MKSCTDGRCSDIENLYMKEGCSKINNDVIQVCNISRSSLLVCLQRTYKANEKIEVRLRSHNLTNLKVLTRAWYWCQGEGEAWVLYSGDAIIREKDNVTTTRPDSMNVRCYAPGRECPNSQPQQDNTYEAHCLSRLESKSLHISQWGEWASSSTLQRNHHQKPWTQI